MQQKGSTTIKPSAVPAYRHHLVIIVLIVRYIRHFILTFLIEFCIRHLTPHDFEVLGLSSLDRKYSGALLSHFFLRSIYDIFALALETNNASLMRLQNDDKKLVHKPNTSHV